VSTRVKQRHEYIIRLFPLSTELGLISSLISAPDIISNGPPGLLRRRRDSFLLCAVYCCPWQRPQPVVCWFWPVL